jgi:hypothetical protein
LIPSKKPSCKPSAKPTTGTIQLSVKQNEPLFNAPRILSSEFPKNNLLRSVHQRKRTL